MGATSVTGKGGGDSNGVFKPENSCGGCGCGGPKNPPPAPPSPVKLGCVIKTVSSGSLTIRTGSTIRTIVCG